MAQPILYVSIAACILLMIGLSVIIQMYKKARQGQALVRTGMGGTNVSFSGLFVIPIIHKLEVMDITFKTIVISRTGRNGLICKDDIRADIKITFFVRANQTMEDIKKIAQCIGVTRAAHQETLELFFDAKFSEAIKTVSRNFDFVNLHGNRDNFKQEILKIIDPDLSGYVIDDCAFDYLDQTPMRDLDKNNILDANGIKKIIELTNTGGNQTER